MKYDYDTDETYFSSRREEEDEFSGKILCEKCGDYKPEEYCTDVSGDAVCNACKTYCIGANIISCCVDCGDYYWTDERPSNEVTCGECC